MSVEVFFSSSIGAAIILTLLGFGLTPPNMSAFSQSLLISYFLKPLPNPSPDDYYWDG